MSLQKKLFFESSPGGIPAQKNDVRGFFYIPDRFCIILPRARICVIFLRNFPLYEIIFLKKALSKELKNCGHDLPHWQPAFFDHLLRSTESYTEKWEYVYRNPARAGLVENPGDWPYSGQIVPLRF